jgi:adenylate cyclase
VTTQEVKRKLTAILSSDAKGYSRLMEKDEAGTIQTLTTYKEGMATLIERHHGRVVDAPGDNVLSEFTSVVDAVRCAVEIQKELKDRNSKLPLHRQMEFRVGINLGDVIEEGNKIFGDGVNIAARMEGLAEGGGICISGSVYDQVKDKFILRFEYLGKQTVKNIAEPVRVYRVLIEPASRIGAWKRRTLGYWKLVHPAFKVLIALVAAANTLWPLYTHFTSPPGKVASKEKMAFPLPDKPSIAILPFVNMSGDPQKDYLSDGITEEIINALCKIPHIFVIARNSTFTYKGKSVKVQQVAEEMGVQYVLEGSVKWSGDRVRVTAQLIDALNGHQLLSERYDLELKDLFTMQDDVTMKVMTAMRVQFTEGEWARAYSKGTKNLEAYLKLMQAYEKRQLFTRESQAQARQLAEEAIALDPSYALAYCHLVHSIVNGAIMSVYKNPEEMLARAMEMAQKAVATDESSGSAHIALGLMHIMYKRDFDEGIAEAERAVALEPNSADVVAQLAIFLHWAGRPAEAIPIFKKALRLCPIPQPRYLFNMAGCYRMMGQYQEAISICKQIILKQPDQLYPHVQLTASYMAIGREAEARAEAAEILRIHPKFSLESFVKYPTRKNQAEWDRMVELLRKAGLN